MKTKLGILTACLLLVAFVASAMGKGTTLVSGNSLTAFGNYSISTSSKALTMDGQALETYELKYSNADTPVLIGLQKTKKCVNFIVRTDNFEVQYVCNRHVFGVKRVNKNYQTVSPKVIDELMDNGDFYSQRIISQHPKTQEELLGLIACYFPSLIKEGKLSQI